MEDRARNLRRHDNNNNSFARWIVLSPRFELFSACLAVASVVLAVIGASPYSLDFKARSHAALYIWKFVDFMFGVAFLCEFAVRLRAATLIREYICSFMGIVDLLVCLISIEDLVSLFWSQDHQSNRQSVSYKLFWLLRIMRLFKLVRYMKGTKLIEEALMLESKSMFAFLACMMVAVSMIGTVMFVIENNETGGFVSIPASIWWAIVTITTVGFGDIVPKTALGQILASCVMLLGYSILAVPTITSMLTSAGYPPGHPSEILAPLQRQRATARLNAIRMNAATHTQVGFSCDDFDVGKVLRGNFRFKVSLQLRPTDCDACGSVHSATYLHLMEAAISAFLVQEAGWNPSASSSRPSVRATSFEVLEPFAFPGDVEVCVTVDSLERTSCSFKFGFFKFFADEICAFGRMRHVWIASSGVEVAPPAAVLDAYRRHFDEAAPKAALEAATASAAPAAGVGVGAGGRRSFEMSTQAEQEAAPLQANPCFCVPWL
mmetsp:Transcript_72642/g.188995  ORF Transcript_72642/g.188995 Transcript_72642/m.188995 type:complete len:491 (+) Transcript_72642:1-1473(+)